MRTKLAWGPALVLGIGALMVSGIQSQHSAPLRESLAGSIPVELVGLRGEDLALADWEQEVVGVSDYLHRVYSPATDAEGAGLASVYVGYYSQQTQGKTIHSPKNCLPGAGWEPLRSRMVMVEAPAGPVRVNHYVLQRGSERALVLYWYQGRGRVEANEFAVKWDLLRDAALRGRSEEALVRIFVPVAGTEDEAFRLAERMAVAVIPRVFHALPI